MTFNPQPKNKPKRDKKYLAWVKEQSCVISGGTASYHHLIGYKNSGTATKASDHLTMPLSDKYHLAFYDTGIHANYKNWEKKYGLQIIFIKKTLDKALQNKVISISDWEIAYGQCVDYQARFYDYIKNLGD